MCNVVSFYDCEIDDVMPISSNTLYFARRVQIMMARISQRPTDEYKLSTK